VLANPGVIARYSSVHGWCIFATAWNKAPRYDSTDDWVVSFVAHKRAARVTL